VKKSAFHRRSVGIKLNIMKGQNKMEHYATANEPQIEGARAMVASPAPLGLSTLAFTTAILGCFYAGFIIPYEAAGMRAAVGAALLIGGIILVLAGMWEFRKNSLMTATIFTSYGGFLGVLGLVFLPGTGILALLGGNVHLLLGLFFLCWLVYTAVLFIGALRTSTSLIATIGLLFIAYLFLTIGELARGSVVLTIIGGWFAIACAIVAWLAAVVSILSTETKNEAFRIPFGHRLAVVE
jgi:succinate-acetate transporter protein